MAAALTLLTATEAVALLRRREISPLDLIEAAAARIAEVEPPLGVAGRALGPAAPSLGMAGTWRNWKNIGTNPWARISRARPCWPRRRPVRISAFGPTKSRSRRLRRAMPLAARTRRHQSRTDGLAFERMTKASRRAACIWAGVTRSPPCAEAPRRPPAALYGIGKAR
jgi:hypothetical protein